MTLTTASAVTDREIRLLLSPLAGALDRSGVLVGLLGPSKGDYDSEDHTVKFELVLPDGARLTGDAISHLTSGCDTNLYLYVASTPGTKEVSLLAKVTTYAGQGDRHSGPEIRATHPLLSTIGLRGIADVNADHVTLSDGKTVPRLTAEYRAPLAGSTIREGYGREFWLTAETLTELQRLPHWTARDLNGQATPPDASADLYTSGDDVILNGQLLTGHVIRKLHALTTHT